MSTPRVNLDFAVHWCSRHLEPFRAEWPHGAGVAMVKLFDAVVRDPTFIERMPRDAEGLAQTEALDAALREHSPLCCWLGDERMKGIYREAGVTP